MTSSIATINALDADAFASCLGPACERSSWIVDRVAAGRPFTDRHALHAAVVRAIRMATADERLRLIRAHPDLAGREAQLGELTAASTDEQRMAGLDQLSAEQAAHVAELNRRYRDRFGFPFIVCARLNVRDAIIATFEARLLNERAMEFDNALAQIGEIIRLRLADLVTDS